jgi:hypothetical protein
MKERIDNIDTWQMIELPRLWSKPEIKYNKGQYFKKNAATHGR